MLCACYKWEQEAGKTKLKVTAKNNQLAVAKHDHGQRSCNHTVYLYITIVYAWMYTYSYGYNITTFLFANFEVSTN